MTSSLLQLSTTYLLLLLSSMSAASSPSDYPRPGVGSVQSDAAAFAAIEFDYIVIGKSNAVAPVHISLGYARCR